MAFDGGAVVRGKDICTAATFAATRVEIVPSGSAKFAHRRAAEVGKRGDAKVTAAMPRATGSMPARGLAASTSTAGQPVLADGNAVIHEVGKRGVAKVYGGDAARCGQYAGGGLGGQHQHAGPAGIGGWKRSYPRGRQTRRCKGYGGDTARYGQYAGDGSWRPASARRASRYCG